MSGHKPLVPFLRGQNDPDGQRGVVVAHCFVCGSECRFQIAVLHGYRPVQHFHAA